MNLEAVPSGSRPVLTKLSVIQKLRTRIPNLFHHALNQGLEVLNDLSVCENSRSDI